MKKYEQIIHDITLMIQNGDLVPGEKLPSIRSLSETYRCNKDTVSKALLELKYQHMIYVKEKSGSYVMSNKMVLRNNGSEFIEFGNSMPDEHLFPYDDFRHCLNQAIKRKQTKLFTYYLNHHGLDELLESLQVYLEKEQIYTKKENMIITTGIQQALYILTQIPFPNKKKAILLEQPTYHMMNRLLKEEKIDYEIIERNETGINLSKLEQLFKTKGIKFFYTTPRFSNPFGNFYTAEQKKKIVTLAEKYNVYIVEDDYLSDFDINHRNLPLHYYDFNQRVIYLKSFSKIIFPALRIGCCILPQLLMNDFLSKKVLIDYDTNLITQMALSIYLGSEMFGRHRKQLAKTYQEKALLLHQTLRFLGYYKKNMGKSLDTKIVFKLKENCDIRELTKNLLEKKITVDFLEQNFIHPMKEHYIKIDVRSMEQSKIKENVIMLFSILKKYIVTPA